MCFCSEAKNSADKHREKGKILSRMQKDTPGLTIIAERVSLCEDIFSSSLSCDTEHTQQTELDGHDTRYCKLQEW